MSAYFNRAAAADLSITASPPVDAAAQRKTDDAITRLQRRLDIAERKFELPPPAPKDGDTPNTQLTPEEREARKVKNKLKRAKQKADMKAGRAARLGAASGDEGDDEN